MLHALAVDYVRINAPAGAIDRKNPGMTDKSKCISCMRCVAICPNHARKVSGFMTAVAGIAIKKGLLSQKRMRIVHINQTNLYLIKEMANM